MLLSWSCFVLGEASLRGFYVYGMQARLAGMSIFVLSAYGFWQMYAKFVWRESGLKLVVISLEILAGMILLAYMDLEVDFFDKDFGIVLLGSFTVLLTEKLWK